VKSGASSPTRTLTACRRETCGRPVARRTTSRRGLRQPGDRGRLGDVGRLDVAVAAALGGQQPDVAVVGERADRVDKHVDEVAVALSVPEQHDVDHLVGVLVDQFFTGVRGDVVAQAFVHVVVVAGFHDDHPGLEAQTLRGSRLTAGRGGRAHNDDPPYLIGTELLA
jgi:hypothetical protein